VSSPTLRKLCLPCITARNHRHHHNRQQTNKHKTSKNNQREIVIAPTAESNAAESTHRFEVIPRTYDPISTISVVHSSEHLRGNDANQSHEQNKQIETSLQNEKIEEKNDEISVEAEIIPTKVVSESILLTLLSPENEITRSNEDDVVGTSL
jgi:hypothetical protein